MRILFRSLPAFGHLYPMMPLAYAARRAGHDVVFSTAGDFVGRLRALGFTTYRAGVGIEEARTARFGSQPPPTAVDGETDWDVIGDLFDECAVRTLDDLLPQIGAIAPDLVVYEQLDVGGAVAAESAGVPAICHSIVRGLDPEIHARLYGDRPHALQERIGTAPSLDIGRRGPVIDVYPPSLQLPDALTNPRRIAVRPVPWSEPSLPLPLSIARSRRPLAYVTFGTVRGYPSPLRAVIDGLAGLDIDVLVATGTLDPSELGALPRRVHVVPFVDQAALWRRIDLAVHHGGCGTTTGAWVHGIPQLVVPQGADQYINAGVVASSGTGIALGDPSPHVIGEAAQRLLAEPAFIRAAVALADEIGSMPSPAAALAAVLAVATGGRSLEGIAT